MKRTIKDLLDADINNTNKEAVLARNLVLIQLAFARFNAMTSNMVVQHAKTLSPTPSHKYLEELKRQNDTFVSKFSL